MKIENTIKKYFTGNNGSGHGIELCPRSNTIRFTVKYENCIHAFVVGDFNGWKKSDDYKLVWQLDTKDGQLKMIKDIKFEEGLKDDTYKYKYILVDCEGNEKWIDSVNEGKEALNFQWVNIKKNIRIISSNNVIATYSPVELIALTIDVYEKIVFPDISWSIEGDAAGISIKDNMLSIDETVKEGQEIIVKAMTMDKSNIATKKIYVRNSIPTTPLIHFFKDDNNYYGADYVWNLWSFQEDTGAVELQLEGNTDFGVSAHIPYRDFIIRKKQWGRNWVNPWAEQSITFRSDNKNNNIYVLNGDSRCYFSLKEALLASETKIKFAVMDDQSKIKVYLSKEPLLGVEFNLLVNGEIANGIATIVRGTEIILTNLPKNINANDLLVIVATNMYSPCKVTMRSYLDKYYYSKDDLGVNFIDDNITFKLWAPTAHKVEVCIYDGYEESDSSYTSSIDMNYDSRTGIHFTDSNNDRSQYEKKYYMYKLYFKDVDNTGNEIEIITYAVDPYANAVGVNGNRGYIIDIAARYTMPMSWKSDKSPYIKKKEDSILYEMHIRDFTINEDSGVKDELKGTYLGAVEENTNYTDVLTGRRVSTALGHIMDLGVTHVHLMPCYDFGSVDETIRDSISNRNWGYDPKNYNVPEGSYSTNPYDPVCRILEFREMIYKFHKNGIRVVMDMVYNHMMDTSNMDKIIPGYYFRSDYLGKHTNGSGCGNEIATERPMIRKFIVDSCMNWIRNYHIDGMRFDLMELMDIKTTKEIVRKTSKIDENFLIYGEPWKGGDSPIKNGTYKGSQKDENFSIFNDIFRDAIRGENSPSKGFINGEQHNSVKAWSIIEGLKGSVYTLTAKPSESINYLEAHDNYIYWDQIEKSQNTSLRNGHYRDNLPTNPMDSAYVRQNLLGAGILFTAQGIPFFQSGSEFLRTKQGDHNSYKSDDTINSIKWKDKSTFIEVFNYYRGLIEIRKAISLFRMENTAEIKAKMNVYFANNDESRGVIISHTYNKNCTFGEVLVIYNATSIDNYDVNSFIPNAQGGGWYVIANDKLSGLSIIDEVNNKQVPLLKSHSIMILFSK